MIIAVEFYIVKIRILISNTYQQDLKFWEEDCEFTSRREYA